MDFIPNTEIDVEAMLRAIGVGSIDDLLDCVPLGLCQAGFRLPSALSEIELVDHMQAVAGQNGAFRACFRGAGAYNHFVPSVVGHITNRAEFYTAYTPYQAEVSQGVLQATFEFQSLICQLTGMDVANASMYDGASALAEGAIMATNVTCRSKVVVASGVHPEYLAVMRTYAQGRGIEIVSAGRRNGNGEPRGTCSTEEAEKLLGDDVACLTVQQPNFFGCLEDLAALGEIAHRRGALFVVAADPISLGLLKPPSEYGADIVVGEGQAMGVPLSFGGPYLGFFGCRERFVRQMPGRVVGMTNDNRGLRSYVLTLQTREQHIRRERATSNICTNEALCALAAAVYLSVMGRQGLREVAELCAQRSHYAARQIAAIPGFSLPFAAPFFKEFVVRCPRPPRELNEFLLARNILGGCELGTWYDDLNDCVLLCVTEMNTRQQIDALVDALREAAWS